MKNLKALNQTFEAITWGTLFIFLGILSLIPGVPPGAGTLGIGIILLGLSLARYLSKIPINVFTVTLGAIALVLGAIVLSSSLLGFQLEGPLFPALLMAIGVYWLICSAKRTENG